MFCKDQITSLLGRLGYNVVRHPSSNIKPMDVLGRSKRNTSILGTLADLIDGPPEPLPNIDPPAVAADIVGQQSSAMKARLGAALLASYVGSIGGRIGVDLSYTNARKVRFEFREVQKLIVSPAKVSRYVDHADLVYDSPLFSTYLLGSGRLYILTEVLQARSFTVRYEYSDGVSARVDVPVVQQLLGADAKIKVDRQGDGALSFLGSEWVTFGFRCFELSIIDGHPTLSAPADGGVPLAQDDAPGASGTLLDPENGLLELEEGRA